MSFKCPAERYGLVKGAFFMDFTHPLARGAKVWTAYLGEGGTRRILVIVTNAVLDPDKKKYNPDHIARLSAAAQEHIAESGEADGFILANRMRDWENSREKLE
ncbi:hypothetical protein LMG27198_09210 [Methylocystis echinoides]|uniref:Uncharacterized protein n=2 Tax=Methylocystis echinoides TaxID=29468 RepID=A0A9W6LR53_9HYPH|nr:hypothetical protein LMG27198_09210 [Methylocystis echinoides]